MLAKDKLVVVRVDLYMLMAMFEQPVLVDVGAAVAGSSVEVRDKPVRRRQQLHLISSSLRKQMGEPADSEIQDLYMNHLMGIK